jgi:uncharacterized membrane protein
LLDVLSVVERACADSISFVDEDADGDAVVVVVVDFEAGARAIVSLMVALRHRASSKSTTHADFIIQQQYTGWLAGTLMTKSDTNSHKYTLQTGTAFRLVVMVMVVVVVVDGGGEWQR